MHPSGHVHLPSPSRGDGYVHPRDELDPLKAANLPDLFPKKKKKKGQEKKGEAFSEFYRSVYAYLKESAIF